MKKIFISFPYSHEEQIVINERVKIAREYCFKLLRDGDCPVSPAIFGHDLIHQLNLDLTEQSMSFNEWDEFCYKYLNGCDELHFILLEGHEKSLGCLAEINKAKELGIKVVLINISDWRYDV